MTHVGYKELRKIADRPNANAATLARWLAEQGIAFKTDLAGRPWTTQASIERSLGNGPTEQQEDSPL